MNVRTQDYLVKYIQKFLYFKCIVYYVLLSSCIVSTVFLFILFSYCWIHLRYVEN